MSTKVEKNIMVNVPVSVAYNQWTQFEDFPHFMGGVKSVTHISDDRLEWVAEIAGVRRKWEAKILEQVPDRKVAWAATEGATNAGSVSFEDVGGGQTQIHLSLDYEPEGLVEKIGDKLNVVEHQAEGDLDRFKAFIEAEGYATGAWRGTISEGTAAAGTPGVEDANQSRGDSGKAGVSGKVAAGIGLAAAAAAAVGVAAAAAGKDANEKTEPGAPEVVVPAGPEQSYAATPGHPLTADDAVVGGEPLPAPASGGSVGHPFDQTNSLIDTGGDSDGTAESDTKSVADREDADTGTGVFPPRLPGGNVSGHH
ncbi:SRPBCC family protein [Paeniglutamicibacter antarcticus]|uniref:SRPBCC family protein n=1 Tax=Arthrobacter terrae TaxID=2935737 RepID=A0A931CRW9_9MICC|nr:SRPBCC family protein [Arthrobacter terrae]MBG0741081.1 SRPBCC family protein [Arthrobacter terrae]